MMVGRLFVVLVTLLLLVVAGCGGGGSTESATGTVTMALTDAPGSQYDNVFITVRAVWFHLLDTAPYDNLNTSGWIRIPLPSPKTLDLLTLRNGAISPDILDNALPAGTYRQILLFLEPTEDPLAPSAAALGLQFNNEVDVGGNRYPLRIPGARQGIRLVGTFSVRAGAPLRLVVDFNAGEDVVEIRRDAGREYLLKPRLTYFDLAHVGAIAGTLDNVSAADPSAFFVVKAESLNGADNSYYVIRRATFVDGATGRFVLYPLAVPEGAPATTYDVVLRGEGYNTVIVKNVPVARGTRPLGTGPAAPTTLPRIDMQPRKASTPDYGAGATVSPTGSWVQFYQTLTGTGLAEKPYVIRFRHANPFTGRFAAFPLSSEDVWWGVYDNAAISLAKTAPAEGTGRFIAAADAPLYDRSAYVTYTAGSPDNAFTLSVSAPAVPRTVPVNLVVPLAGLDNGIALAVHGGMIVDAKDIAGQVGPGTRRLLPNPLFTLPGGSPAAPRPFAFYGIDALAWKTGGPGLAVGLPRVADLRTADSVPLDILMMGVIP